jgi:hypothetical protein
MAFIGVYSFPGSAWECPREALPLPLQEPSEAEPRLLTLCLFSGSLFIQFLIRELAFMTTVLSLDPPKSLR